MNENLVKRLRDKASALDYDGWVDTAASLEEAAGGGSMSCLWNQGYGEDEK